MSQVTEAELIAASKKGDVRAFNQLVVSYERVVYNLAYRMVGDPDLAADIAQDTFTSAFRAVGSFRGGSFKSWVLRIAANACHDHYRRQKRRPADSLDALQEAPGCGTMLIDHSDGPEEVALRREMVEYINKGLGALPEEQRLVVILADVQGLSYDEIAEVTRSSLGTVKSRLSRGRAHLRDFLLRRRELLPSRLRPKTEDESRLVDADIGAGDVGAQPRLK